MNGLLRRLGVAPRTFFALLRVTILLETRSQSAQTATAVTRRFAPIVLVIVQHLLISSAMTLQLFGRTSVFEYSLVSIGVSMFLLACALVVEFNEVVFDPCDQQIVGHLPIPSRTYAAVRLVNLFLYLGLLGTALNIVPAIAGVWLPEAGWRFLPAYLVAAGGADAFAAACVILVYLALSGALGQERLRDALAYVQLGFTLLAIYLLQLADRSGNGGFVRALSEQPPWLAWTPPGWYAALTAAVTVGPQIANCVQAALAIAGLVAIGGSMWRQLSKHYAAVSTGVRLLTAHESRSLAARREMAWLWPLARLTSRSPEETTAYWFCWTMFCRDHELKMRTYPSLGAALGFFLIGWLGNQLEDPFVADSVQAAAPSMAILYVLVVAVPIVAQNLAYSRDYPAAWAFYTAPLRSPAAFATGLCSMIMTALVGPVLLVLFVGFSLTWGNPLHAGVHTAAGLLLCRLAAHVARLGIIRHYPLSRRFVRGEGSGRTALFVGIVMVAATLLGLYQLSAYRSPTALAGFFVVLLVSNMLLAPLSRRLAAKHLALSRLAATS